MHVPSRRSTVASLAKLTELSNVYRRNIAGPKNPERTRRSATSFSRCDAAVAREYEYECKTVLALLPYVALSSSTLVHN